MHIDITRKKHFLPPKVTFKDVNFNRLNMFLRYPNPSPSMTKWLNTVEMSFKKGSCLALKNASEYMM